MKVGIFVSIRYDSYLESIIRRIAYRQTDTINSHRTLVYRDIATFRHFFIKCIFKCKIPASFRILDFHTSSRLIYVSLHDMSIQSAIHHHAALYIHLIAHFQQTKIRTVQRFFHGSYRIRIISQTHYRQAYSVVRNTLINLQLIYKRTLKCKVYILLVFHQCYQSSVLFYDSRKHNMNFKF